MVTVIDAWAIQKHDNRSMNVKNQVIRTVINPATLLVIILTFTIVLANSYMFISLGGTFIVDGTRVIIFQKDSFIGPSFGDKSISPIHMIETTYNLLDEKIEPVKVTVKHQLRVAKHGYNVVESQETAQKQKAEFEAKYKTKYVSPEYKILLADQNDINVIVGLSVLLITLMTLSLYVMAYLPVRRIISISNMEKRSKHLQKIGIEEFVEKTDATLIDKSSRGNSLYESYSIIKNTQIRFLVYQDISTDRKYIKYVPIVDRNGNKLDTADEAQSWSLSLTLEQYKSMTIEA